MYKRQFAGRDFNFLLELSGVPQNTLFVGDYYQHTYDTSRDGSVRVNLHKKGVDAYAAEFTKQGFEVDQSSLSKSYRCSASVCGYIRETVGIEIYSHRSDDTEVCSVDDLDQLREIHSNPKIVKLFYQKHGAYNCHSNNWGASKGLDRYEDVCVVLNNTSFALIQAGKGHEIKDGPKSKLYVACSRARGSLYIVSEKTLKNALK